MPHRRPHHYRLQKSFMAAAGVALVCMMLLTIIDIVARSFFTPILGSVELLGLMGAVAASFALGYTQIHDGHLAIDILVERLMMRRTTRRFNSVVFSLFFLVIGIYLLRQSWIYFSTGELTETLQIVFYPFVIAAALGFFSLCIALVMDVIYPPDRSEEEAL